MAKYNYDTQVTGLWYGSGTFLRNNKHLQSIELNPISVV